MPPGFGGPVPGDAARPQRSHHLGTSPTPAVRAGPLRGFNNHGVRLSQAERRFSLTAPLSKVGGVSTKETFDVVTGAFGYTGKYITRRLLGMGQRVKTLTGHPERPSPFGDEIEVARFDFDNPQRLIANLRACLRSPLMPGRGVGSSGWSWRGRSSTHSFRRVPHNLCSAVDTVRATRVFAPPPNVLATP